MPCYAILRDGLWVGYAVCCAMLEPTLLGVCLCHCDRVALVKTRSTLHVKHVSVPVQVFWKSQDMGHDMPRGWEGKSKGVVGQFACKPAEIIHTSFGACFAFAAPFFPPFLAAFPIDVETA